MHGLQRRELESRYGWVMVGVGFVMLALNFGGLISISVFLKPLTAQFGWLRGETAFAYTAGGAAIGVCGIAWGWLADRYGARRVVLLGAVMQGVALWMLARLELLWQFYACYVLLGGLGFAAINVPLIANVGQWFSARKGLALGIVSAGGALGQGIVPYVARWLISGSGWQSAYTTLAIAYLAIGVPLALLVRTAPRQATAQGAAAAAPAAAEAPPLMSPQRAVAWLSTAVIFCCICMAVPLVHVVALITDRGIAPQTAAAVFMTLMVAGLVGRVLMGRLADAWGGLRAYVAASLAQTLVVFWFTQVHSLAALYVVAALFGLGFSGVMTCIWVCVREMVPPRAAGTSLGFVVFFAWIGMGLGGWLGGYWYDLTGSYGLPFALAALAGIINLAILGSLWFHLARRHAALEARLATT